MTITDSISISCCKIVVVSCFFSIFEFVCWFSHASFRPGLELIGAVTPLEDAQMLLLGPANLSGFQASNRSGNVWEYEFGIISEYFSEIVSACCSWNRTVTKSKVREPFGVPASVPGCAVLPCFFSHDAWRNWCLWCPSFHDAAVSALKIWIYGVPMGVPLYQILGKAMILRFGNYNVIPKWS